MAKESMKAREVKRAKLVAKYAAKRQALKEAGDWAALAYMLVIGDRDMENGTVSVRTRKGEDLGAMTPDAFIAKCLMEIATKSKEV